MDRRQIKTRQAILNAFSTLLEQKQYTQITVQDIIDEANIGRSTFYAHFETKDELLNSMCSDIFAHVFSDTPEAEISHDFTHSTDDLNSILTHILFHLYDKQKDITRILRSHGQSIFMGYFKEQLFHTFHKYKTILRSDLSEEFVLNLLCTSFADTVGWWLCEHIEISPTEISKDYMKSLSGVFLQ